MRKRILSFILTLCILASLTAAFPITANAAASGTCGDNLIWTLDDEGTLTISGTGDMYSYNYSMWDSKAYIKNAVIEAGVTSIGDYVFAHCTDLTSIDIPSSVTSIGDYAFFYCSSLTGVSIPDSVTSIGGHIFSGCISLTRVDMPNSTTSIENYAFCGCASLTGVSIPESVTNIGDWAFWDCGRLKDVYYSGTKEQWQEISIGRENKYLTNSAKHYNYTPADNEKNKKASIFGKFMQFVFGAFNLFKLS